jgi:hypothetical protein
LKQGATRLNVNGSPQMEQTRLTANLPKLDVELVHVQDPEEHAEVITIKMTANPSFEAVGDYLAKSIINPTTMMWAIPFGLWSGILEAAWRPWLSALTPRLPAPETRQGGRDRPKIENQG